MAFPKHARAQFGGSLLEFSGRSEIWSCSLSLSTHAPAGEWLSHPQEYADAVADALATWFTGADGHCADTSTLEYLKVNNINPDGTYADPVTHQHLFASGLHGHNSQVAPSFTSVCLTWETEVARGHASRGRIYPPNYTFIPQGSQLSGGDITGIINSAKALLNVFLINEPISGHLVYPVVVSKIDAAQHDIQGVSCDNVYDYQSRRKNRVAGTRTRSVWP